VKTEKKEVYLNVHPLLIQSALNVLHDPANNYIDAAASIGWPVPDWSGGGVVLTSLVLLNTLNLPKLA